MIKPGIYRHYKGGLYELIAIGTNSETLEPMCIYREVYGDQEYWVRPAYMWEEQVGDKKRFELVRETYRSPK